MFDKLSSESETLWMASESRVAKWAALWASCCLAPFFFQVFGWDRLWLRCIGLVQDDRRGAWWHPLGVWRSPGWNCWMSVIETGKPSVCHWDARTKSPATSCKLLGSCWIVLWLFGKRYLSSSAVLRPCNLIFLRQKQIVQLQFVSMKLRLAIQIVTGRQHQIRLQMAHIGHPMVTDKRHLASFWIFPGDDMIPTYSNGCFRFGYLHRYLNHQNDWNCFIVGEVCSTCL